MKTYVRLALAALAMQLVAVVPVCLAAWAAWHLTREPVALFAVTFACGFWTSLAVFSYAWDANKESSE